MFYIHLNYNGTTKLMQHIIFGFTVYSKVYDSLVCRVRAYGVYINIVCLYSGHPQSGNVILSGPFPSYAPDGDSSLHTYTLSFEIETHT